MSIGIGERSLADLERGAKRCISHHFACDCRELAYQKRIAELEKGFGSTRRALVELMEFCRTLIAMGAVETPAALKNELERAGECLKERA